MVQHNTLHNNPDHSHGIVWRTVANSAARLALTITNADVEGRKVILQLSDGTLWVPISTTPTFQVLGNVGNAVNPELSDFTREWHVGKHESMYPTLTAAYAAIAATATQPSSTNRATVYVHTGYYDSTALGTYSVPRYVTTRGLGGKGAVQLFNSAANMFTPAAGDVWFQDLLIEGSNNTNIYAFDCNNQSRIHLKDVDMFDNAGTARQKYLTQSGATWSVLKLEHCDVDYNGLSLYPISIFNTGAVRQVDCWMKDIFVDCFALTSGGGAIELSKVRDVRIWDHIIRGPNTESPPGTKIFTGVRVRNGSGTGITVELGPGYIGGAEAGSGGVAVFGDANTLTTLGGGVARGAVVGAQVVNPGNLTYVAA